MRCVCLALLLLLTSPTAEAGRSSAESVCYGTSAHGRLEGGRRLPRAGPNFKAYSTLGVLAGRTYVHSCVRRVLLAAYAAAENSMPDVIFVYGETGFREGGPFKPHKTHQNGLSIDHMVPVRDAEGRSLPLPTGPFNKFGYSIEFDEKGRWGSLIIDTEALSELLYQLDRAARQEGIGIRRVIYDPELRRLLRETRRWEYLETHIEFSKKRSWVRHDEHFHVDFRVSCG